VPKISRERDQPPGTDKRFFADASSAQQRCEPAHGLRPGEALGLQHRDWRTGRGDTPFVEVVPCDGNLPGARVKGGHYRRVFVSGELDRLYGEYLWQLCEAGADAALRHSHATALLLSGIPVHVVSRRPLRAAIACRLCTATRGIQQPVPVHLPAHQQLCIRRGIWLPGPETPQFSVRGCPDILDAERRARRLLRQCTIEQLVYSTTQKPGEAGEQSWKRRAAALIESNPRSAAESSPQEMFLAAAYPDAIAAARARSKRFREQSSLTETALADRQKQANQTSCRPRVDNTDSSPQVSDAR